MRFRRGWSKSWARQFWGRAGTVNRVWTLWVLSAPAWAATFRECPNFGHDYVWRRNG